MTLVAFGADLPVISIVIVFFTVDLLVVNRWPMMRE